VFALFFFAVDTLDLEVGFAWVYVMQGVGLRILFPPRAGHGAKMWMSCQLHIFSCLEPNYSVSPSNPDPNSLRGVRIFGLQL
jgi:hypothetical protein